MNCDSHLQIEVNLDHLIHNVESLMNLYPNYHYYFGMVGANAYGHGFGIVKSLIQAGINYLVVATFQEALQVRQESKKIPVLCLELIDEQNVLLAMKENITVAIYRKQDINMLQSLKSKKKLNAHFCIATQEGQLGISTKEELKEIFSMLDIRKVTCEGIYTQLEGTSELSFNQSVNRFMEITSVIELSKIPIVHIYSSQPLIRYPKLKIANGVRLGIVMYGINPTNEILDVGLREALLFNSKIAEIKMLRKEDISNLKLAKDHILVGIVPVGFMHHFSKNHIGRNITVNFKRFKIIDVRSFYMLVEIDEDIQIGDKVTLYGGLISMKEASQYLNQSVYELLYHLPGRIARCYYENNEFVLRREGR